MIAKEAAAACVSRRGERTSHRMADGGGDGDGEDGEEEEEEEEDGAGFGATIEATARRARRCTLRAAVQVSAPHCRDGSNPALIHSHGISLVLHPPCGGGAALKR